MVSKYTLALVLVIVLVHTLPTFQLFEIPTQPREEHILMFKPSDTKAIIEVDGIIKAVWDAGFKIMSLILQNHLRTVVPFGGTYPAGCRLCYATDSVTIYNNNTITIFAPVDESFSDDENWKVLEYQFVTARVDKEAFDSGSVQRGVELLTCDSYCKVLVNGYGSINNVNITHWNIYNDGHIIVHGVQNFFNCNFWKSSKNI
ncbi:Uncharacterized protein TCM_038456 [Theobroma cacao]|uniref:Uncharacterized protein n=1 Tax=Theobroma cacao TaxID=3641 RepID=A0A061GWP4_THECC|nr:Uncharacterized protein TCM_038456 [Theobroma cacao]